MGSLQASSMDLMHFNALVTPLALSNIILLGKEVKLIYLLYLPTFNWIALHEEAINPVGVNVIMGSFNEHQV